MTGFVSGTRQIGGTRWYVRESTAEPEDPEHLVIFIPGLGEGAYIAPHGSLLARHWRVVIPDMPGFGRSRGPHRLTSVDAFAEAATEFVADRADGAVYLVGSSFGAQVALAVAAAAPRLLTRLVLVSPTFEAGSRTLLGQLRRWLPTMVGEPSLLAVGLAKSYAHSGLRTPILAFRAGLHDAPEERAPRVSAPTLVVRGGRDHIVSARWARQLVDCLPAGQLATIAGGWHTLDFALPGALAAVTVRFLQDS